MGRGGAPGSGGGWVVLKTRSRTPAGPAASPSIAVLPFQNFGGGAEDEYLSDGLTEAILTDLARAPGLMVIARNSAFQYKGRGLDVKKVAGDLKVRYVLEGSVQRSADRLRVQAQLIDASTGYHIWADRYDREMKDLLAVQEDIAGSIVAALRIRIGPEEAKAAAPPTRSPEAYEYLRGLFQSGKRQKAENEIAITLFELRVGPRRPGGCVPRSIHRLRPAERVGEKAYVEIQKALALAPDLAEAYEARGRLTWTPSNRFPHEVAARDFRRALELNPNLAGAHVGLAIIYSHTGLFDRSLEELEAAERLDPGRLSAVLHIAMVYLWQQRHDEVLAEFDRVPALEAGARNVALTKLSALAHLGRTEEGLRLARALVKGDDSDDAVVVAAYALLLARAGDGSAAEEQIARAPRLGKGLGHYHHVTYVFACALSLMKKNREALEWLEKAAEDGFPCYPLFEKDPDLDGLRGDPAFQALMTKTRAQWERYRATL